jgi:chromosomal replication initiation ATPase DnaA
MNPIMDLFRSVLCATGSTEAAAMAVYAEGFNDGRNARRKAQRRAHAVKRKQRAAVLRDVGGTERGQMAFLFACQTLSIEPDKVLRRSRERKYVEARRLVWAEMRKAGLSYPEIAMATGMRDHTTVMHGLRARSAA